MKISRRKRPLLVRFEEKIIRDPNSGCWLFDSSPNPNGYGQISINLKPKLAHRAAWELYVGEIPDGLNVCHKCDTPLCVRPDHLFLGTQMDNLRDASSKGRTRNQYMNKSVCPRGHAYSGEYTRQRICHICRRAAHKRWYDKNRRIKNEQ